MRRSPTRKARATPKDARRLFPVANTVGTASPYKTLRDLLDAARGSPGKITLASPGPGTTFHIALETLKHAANVNMTYVPYAATPPALENRDLTRALFPPQVASWSAPAAPGAEVQAP